MMRLSGLLLAACITASAQIPQGYGEFNLLSGVSSPAIALIGNDARLIAYPSDPADITFCLMQLADSLAEGPGTFSLALAPYWLTSASDSLDYLDYAAGGGPLTAIPQTLTISLAVSNEMQVPTNGTGIALGVQASLIRPSTDDVLKLDTLRMMHDTLSLNAVVLLDSLRNADTTYISLKKQLLSTDSPKEERVLELQLEEMDSLFLQQLQVSLAIQLDAARQCAESFGLVRRGFYADIAGGVVEFFTEDDIYSNSVYRYGFWSTCGFLAPPWTFNAIGKYQGYREGEIDYEVDTGFSTSVNLSHSIELSGECILRNSRLVNGENDSTNRVDLAFTIPFIRNSTVTVTVGKDFDAEGQGSLMTRINVIAGLGSSRPAP